MSSQKMLSGGGDGSDDDINKDGDRLSSLPEPIIHHIFSFLETIDIVRASMVSRKWRYFWLSMPYLSFERQPGCSAEKFRDFINWVLMSRNRSGDIQRFSVSYLDLDDDYTFCRWMDVITGKNLQELDLIIRTSVEIELPQCILNCGSSVSLNLLTCGPCVLKHHILPGFRRLKSLKLSSVEFLDTGLLGNLISRCPVLEDCTIDACSFRDGLKILDITAPTLKNLRLHFSSLMNYQLKLACPNLVSLTLSYLSSMHLLFEEMNSLQNLFMNLLHLDKNVAAAQSYHVMMSNILKAICSVKVLKVSETFMKYLQLAVDSSVFFSASFNNLKSLTFILDFTDFFGQPIVNLLNWSPNLEALTITLQKSIWKSSRIPGPAAINVVVQSEDRILEVGGSNLHYAAAPSTNFDDHWNMLNKNISCLKSHLKIVELIGVGDDKYELDLIRFFLKNGHVLEKMRICWGRRYFWRPGRNVDKIISKLMKFPRLSPNVTLTFIKPEKPLSPFY